MKHGDRVILTTTEYTHAQAGWTGTIIGVMGNCWMVRFDNGEEVSCREDHLKLDVLTALAEIPTTPARTFYGGPDHGKPDLRPRIYTLTIAEKEAHPETIMASFDGKLLLDLAKKEAASQGMWPLQEGPEPTDWIWGGDEGEVMVIDDAIFHGHALDLLAASV